jgi:ribose transport system permease protein
MMASDLPRSSAPKLSAISALASVAAPLVLLAVLLVVFGMTIPNYLTGQNLIATVRQFAEFGFVALAIGIVIVSGGIDLSVGATFAMANFLVLLLLHHIGLSPWLAIPLAILLGGLIGAANGFLVGVVGLGAFLTTLVTMLLVRAFLNLLILKYSLAMALAFNDNAIWAFLGSGRIASLPVNLWALILAGIGLHFTLQYGGFGWHIRAVGASAQAARNAGIAVNRTLVLTYAFSGMLAACGGILYASRLNSPSSDTGAGFELVAITAVVLGGLTLNGGRGTVAQILLGALTMLLMINGFVRLGMTGGANSLLTGVTMILAVGLGIVVPRQRARWSAWLERLSGGAKR